MMKTSIPKISIASLAIAAALALTVPAAVAEQGGGASAKGSVWSGVYSTAQGKRGEEVHDATCASCHGARLNGAGQPDMPPSPAIAGNDFLRKWAGKTVAELFVYVHTKMPPDNPGELSEQQSIDAVAHMLAVSNIPAGETELPPDAKALAGFTIDVKAK